MVIGTRHQLRKLQAMGSSKIKKKKIFGFKNVMERSRTMHGSRVPFALALLGIRNSILFVALLHSISYIRYFQGQVLSKNTSLPFFITVSPKVKKTYYLHYKIVYLRNNINLQNFKIQRELFHSKLRCKFCHISCWLQVSKVFFDPLSS